MKFTVLMSVYDKENSYYLEQALDSIFSQTVKPNEVVIVKDGPLNDDLNSCFDLFKNENIKYVQLEENMGLGKALAIGFDYCTNEIIARMDSDDICLNTRFEQQINYLKNNPEVDVVGSQMGEFNEKLGDLNSVRVVPLSNELILKMAKRRNPMNHISVMFRKSAVKESGGYLPLQYLEDYYLWVRMLVNGKVFRNLDEILVYARVGNGMYKRRGNKNQIKGFKTIMKILEENKIITKFGSKLTILKLRIFLMVPSSIKKILYKSLLRRSSKDE